jgi:anti-anti-sigma factor
MVRGARRPARARLRVSVLSTAARHDASAGAGVGTAAGTIVAERDGDVAVVRLCGEIDGALQEQADAALEWVLAEGRPVVVDACSTLFVDSSGIAFLVRCAHACARAGLTLTLRDAPPQMAQVLTMLGLDALFGGGAGVRSRRTPGAGPGAAAAPGVPAPWGSSARGPAGPR